MTVNEMILLLQQMPGDAIVVLSSDSEGNSFTPYSGDYTFAHYKLENGDTEVYFEDDDEETELPEDTEKCVVLWP